MAAVRTSLEVGFAGGLPENFLAYRGRTNRAIPTLDQFPFEDAQFEVVMLASAAFSPATIREAHRVLKPDGRLHFILPEKTSRQAGWTLDQVYTLMRDGFHLTAVERPAWWFFRRTGRTLAVTAQKKNWRTAKWQSLRPSYSRL